MIPYIEYMVKYFTKHNETMKTSLTAASHHLFKIREGAIVLEVTQANIYHNFVSKSLFDINIERLDIHTAVAFIKM